MTNKLIWAAALAAVSLGAAPAAQAGVVSTGWVRNAVVTQEMCVQVAHAVGLDAGFNVTTTATSATLTKTSGELAVIVCDAAPIIFFVAEHDTHPAAEVEAIADMIEEQLVARVNALTAAQ